jgi:(S)-mandelate dehydrogenase
LVELATNGIRWLKLTPTFSLDWDDIAELRRTWKGNLIIKGVLHPETAIRAANAGADGILVSNHGGRLFDGAITPADILPTIVDRVGDKLTVLADSGIRRGSDIAKLLAMGAKSVLVGRGFVFGVAASGQEGAYAMIETLKDELDRTMAYLGCSRVDEIRPQLLFSTLLRQYQLEEPPVLET